MLVSSLHVVRSWESGENVRDLMGIACPSSVCSSLPGRECVSRGRESVSRGGECVCVTWERVCHVGESVCHVVNGNHSYHGDGSTVTISKLLKL